MASAVIPAKRSPSFREFKNAPNRRIHFIQKISPQTGNPALVKLRSLPNLDKCGCQEPIVHLRNSLRSSASASGPGTASILPSR